MNKDLNGKPSKKRYPHRTRKNKAGEYVLYIRHKHLRVNKSPRTRCPYQTRKNKAGKCVPYIKHEFPPLTHFNVETTESNGSVSSRELGNLHLCTFYKF